MNRLYWFKLWRHNRLGALLVLGLVLGHVGIHLSKMQVFPFYLYAMYSLPNWEQADRVYTVYQVQLNGTQPLDFKTWNNERYTYFYNQLERYGQTVANGYQAPSAGIIQNYARYLPAWQIERWQALYQLDSLSLHQAYETWLKRYLSSLWPEPIERVEVWAIFYHWQPGQKPEEIRRSPLRAL